MTDKADIPAVAGLSRKPAQVPRDLPRSGPEAVRFFLKQRSPQLLLALALGTLAARLLMGGWHWLDGVIVAALLLYWPLNEWLIHVFVLHSRRIPGIPSFDHGVARSHRAHHADPWDPRWVFIPLQAFPATLPLLVGVAWLLTWDVQRMLSFLAAYLLLSLHYEWVHYLAHIGWCPKIRYYQRRVREHRLHHFRNENYWWGVSMGLGDRLLGTARDPQTVTPSGTTGSIPAGPTVK